MSDDMKEASSRKEAKRLEAQAASEAGRELRTRQDDASGAKPQDSPSARREQARQVARELWGGLATQALPWFIGAGVMTAALITAAFGWPTRALPLGVVLAVALGAGVTAGKQAGTRGWRLHAGLATVTTCGWLAAAAATGAPGRGWTLLGFLAAFAGTSVPWWVAHARPMPDTAAERNQPTPAPAPVSAREHPAARTWRDTVAHGDLAGSTLHTPAAVPGGWKATVFLDPGKAGYSTVEKYRERIASAFRVPLGNVQIQQAPQQEADRAVLTVLTEDVLNQVRPWPGVTLTSATGLARVGMFADSAPASWRVFRPGDGVVHSLVSGTYGTGKSVFLMQLHGEMTGSGLGVTWFADPQEGQSAPELKGHADWFAAGDEAVMTMLRAAKAVISARSRHLARLEWTDKHGRAHQGVRCLDPTPDMPILTVYLDEAPQVLTDPAYKKEARQLIGDIGKRGRKCGVQIVVITQLPGLSELGDQTVRAMLKGGNVISFRTDSEVAKGQLGLQADPARIPDSFPDGASTAGVGYLSGPDNKGGVRMRAYFIDDMYAVAQRPAPALDRVSADGAAQFGYVGSGQITELDGDETTPNPPDSSRSEAGGSDADVLVRRALDQGTPPRLPAVMRATGLPLAEAKRALSRLN